DPQKNLQTIIIFDDDGSIKDTLCSIYECEAAADATVFDGSQANPGNIRQGFIILGLLNGGNVKGTINKWEAVILHEVGHLLGLAHPSVNQEIFIDDNVSMFNLMPTMIPGLTDESTAVLNPDDIAGINSLYPPTASPTDLATIKGEVLKSD